jgi:hypothetical protein
MVDIRRRPREGSARRVGGLAEGLQALAWSARYKPPHPPRVGTPDQFTQSSASHVRKFAVESHAAIAKLAERVAPAPVFPQL